MMEKKNLDKVIIGVSLVVIFILTMVIFYNLRILPRYKNLYEYLGGILPFLTRLYLLIGSMITRWFILLMPLLYLGFGALVSLPLIIKNKTFLARLYTGLALLFFIFILFSQLALRLPIMRLKQIIKRNFTSEEIKVKMDKIEKYLSGRTSEDIRGLFE